MNTFLCGAVPTLCVRKSGWKVVTKNYSFSGLMSMNNCTLFKISVQCSLSNISFSAVVPFLFYLTDVRSLLEGVHSHHLSCVSYGLDQGVIPSINHFKHWPMSLTLVCFSFRTEDWIHDFTLGWNYSNTELQSEPNLCHFWDRISLCILGCLWTQSYHPTPVCWVL